MNKKDEKKYQDMGLILEDENNQLKRVLLTQSSNSIAKDRSGNLGKYEAPDLGKIKDKIYAE